MNLRRLAAVTAVVMALAVGLSACGSAGGGPGAVASVTGPAGAPIIVGQFCTCSGPLAASTAASGNVLKAWADQVNASGGLNGHRIELFSEDVGTSPEATLAAAKKLVEQDHVVALVGVVATAASAAAAYLKQAGVPVVGGYPYDIDFSTSPGWFISGEGPAANDLALYYQAAAAGIKKVGLMYCAEAPACAQANALGKVVAPLAGVGYTGISVSASQPNYTAACLAFKNANVDGLFIGTASDLLPRIMSDCANVGYRPRVIDLATTFSPTLLKNPAFEGSLWTSANANYLDTSIPGVARLHSAMAKYADSTLNDPSFTPTGTSAFWGGLLFEAASKAAGGFTPETTSAQVTAALNKLSDETLEGTAPPLSFTAGKPGFPTCSFPMQITNGKLVSLNGGKPLCLSTSQVASLVKLVG